MGTPISPSERRNMSTAAKVIAGAIRGSVIRSRMLGQLLTSLAAFSSRGFTARECDGQQHGDRHEGRCQHEGTAKEAEECRGDCLRPSGECQGSCRLNYVMIPPIDAAA